MARIRTIKPEFFDHEKLFDLEASCGLPIRLAFIGLWTQCDREGRFKWEPRRLKTRILPYDEVDFSRVLDALATRGFVVKYATESGEFGYVPSFPRHQVINNREKESELPQPPEVKGKVDASGTREPRDDHAGKAERKGKEGKGKEGKGREGKDACEYSFSGKTVRLKTEDYLRWKEAYHAIPDFNAALNAADDWISGENEKDRKRWFNVISASLAKKHQAFLEGEKGDCKWLV